jgi:hypothetical protein
LKFFAVLQLCRISNVLSAVSNVLVGYLWLHNSWEPAAVVVLLALASGCFYVSGMILNDLFDYEYDKANASKRPLAAGVISIGMAKFLGFGFLIGGSLIALTAFILNAYFYESTLPSIATGIIVIISLVLAILIYDAVSKKTLLAPWIMGLVRALNMMMGMVIAGLFASEGAGQFHFVDAMLLGGMFFYVSGITWYASKERQAGNTNRLFLGLVCIVLGFLCWSLIPSVPGAELRIGSSIHWGLRWPLYLALFLSPTFLRLILGFVQPIPSRIQAAVVSSLYSIIVIDALLCWICVNQRPIYAIIIFSFCLPTYLLSRSFRPT